MDIVARRISGGVLTDFEADPTIENTECPDRRIPISPCSGFSVVR
jgi:hypothetical protein